MVKCERCKEREATLKCVWVEFDADSVSDDICGNCAEEVKQLFKKMVDIKPIPTFSSPGKISKKTLTKKPMQYSNKLYLTSGRRIVIDNHGYETFCEPYDKPIATFEELSKGINLQEFMKRLMDALMSE